MSDRGPWSRALAVLGIASAVAAGGAAAADGASETPRIGDVALQAAAVSPAPKADGDVLLLEEGFESTWPTSPWRVSHPPSAADVDWGRTGHRASAGEHSIRCAGAGPDAPPVGDPAPLETTSWAIAGPFDLSEASSGRLSFDLWLRTERVHDLFMWLVSTDGTTFSGSATTTDSDGWRSVSVDLGDWGDAGSVLGEDRVWIAFVYTSDHSRAFEGAYVDEVRLTADFGNPATEGVTYTTADDFATGTMVGVDPSGDALELADGWSTLPYVWVPNTTEGTVSRLDVTDGAELSRYRVGPDRELLPSAVAVDLDGSCWVGNPAAGSVVKIGLEERGDCVDRDADGEIDTSRDADGDGDITNGELLAWGADECVLYEAVLVAGAVAVYPPGETHDSYLGNGLRALAVDADNDVWLGVADDRLLYRLDGATGAVVETQDLTADDIAPSSSLVDGNGRLWVASAPSSEVLRLDNGGGEDLIFTLPHAVSAVGLDGAGHLFAAAGDGGEVSQVDVSDGGVVWTRDAGVDATAVAATEDGDAWVAVPGGRIVQRLTDTGFVRATVQVDGAPTELAVDSEGRVWAVGATSGLIERIDPSTSRKDLEVVLVDDGVHDATGDLTGVVARALVTRLGTWRTVFDSGQASTPWGTVDWTGAEPAGTAVTVRVRSSGDQVGWSGWEEASSGVELESTPAGRYLQIEAVLQVLSGNDLPRVDELTVTPAAAVDPPVAGFTWTPSAPVAGTAVQFTDASTGDPASWSWELGDGATSSDRNPSHVYASEGMYTVTLTAANTAGSDTASADVPVAAAGACSLVCAATVPVSATTGNPVAFQATATATGCAGAVAYEWSFGDGTASADAVAAHIYSSSGVWPWRLEVTVDDESCIRSGTIEVSGDVAGCSRPRWLPVASHAAGAAGSVWRTDLGLLGVSSQTTTADLRLHASDGVTTREVEIAPGEMLDVPDVVRWIRAGASLSAAVEVCADEQLVVTSRTYNQLADGDPCLGGGTFGQRLDGSEPSEGLHAGDVALLPQLRENQRFRTNLGFTNTGVDPATVEVSLRDGDGVELAAYTVSVEPGEWRQDNSPFDRRGGAGQLDAGSVRLEVVSGAGVLVYASVIDRITNDASTVLATTVEPAG